MNYNELSAEEFNFKNGVIAGDECVLITPRIGAKWTAQNKRYRSCIVRQSDGHFISQGFSKYTNVGEAPEFDPWNETWKFEARHKIDGSCIIISKYKGELIIRTRGTFSARQMKNGHEIDLLISKYPKVFDNTQINSEECSILLEWTTPSNIICLREHDEPTLTLIGASWHCDGAYFSQEELDALALHWNVARPKSYSYNSLIDCIEDVKLWTDKEGVVLYSPCGQILKKIKGDFYLRLHALMSSVGNISNLIDVYLTSDRSADSNKFYEYIKTIFDFEIAEKCKEDIYRICLAHQKIKEKQQKCRELVNKMGDIPRKEKALDICAHYNDWRRAYSFSILDGKELDHKTLKTILLGELGEK